MPILNLSDENWTSEALKADGPTCLIMRARLMPVAELDRFQPAGFPEIGHVIYDAPRKDHTVEKVCIVDSPASMANHLEAVCLDGPTGLHRDLKGLPYVQCVTDRGDAPVKDDRRDTLVCTTLTEGHRLASDYFLDGLVDVQWHDERKEQLAPEKGPGRKGKDAANEKSEKRTIPGQWAGTRFRDRLRGDFRVTEIQKDKTYFIKPDAWWQIYTAVFKYDPNSLVHGVLFAKEQIKISRLLTAHHEAFGAARVGRSGVKFDRLGKTTSGQPIFAAEDETAHEIRATFIIDLALLRSYGRDNKGLSDAQKRLLLELAVWKIKQLLSKPFRYRSGCHLACERLAWLDETDMGRPSVNGDATPPLSEQAPKKPSNLNIDIQSAIKGSKFGHNPVTSVYYPAAELFKTPKNEKDQKAIVGGGEEAADDNENSEETEA